MCQKTINHHHFLSHNIIPMGNEPSKSKSQNVIKNNTINKTDIDVLEKTTLNVGIESLNKASQNCSSTIAQNNACRVRGLNIGGDFNFSANQTNAAISNLSCINDQKVSNDMSSSMVTSIMGSLDALNGTDSAAALNSAAAAKSETAFGATGGGSSSSASGKITNNVTNETKVAIQNVLENNFNTNFTSEMLSNCINRTTQNNEVELTDITIGGKANIPCVQTNSLQQVTECKAMQEAVSKSIVETAKNLGFDVGVTNTSSTTSDSATSAVAESKSTGPISEIMDGISSIFGAIFGNVILGWIICFIIVGFIVYFLFFRGGGATGSATAPTAVDSTTFEKEDFDAYDNDANGEGTEMQPMNALGKTIGLSGVMQATNPQNTNDSSDSPQDFQGVDAFNERKAQLNQYNPQQVMNQFSASASKSAEQLQNSMKQMKGDFNKGVEQFQNFRNFLAPQHSSNNPRKR